MAADEWHPCESPWPFIAISHDQGAIHENEFTYTWPRPIYRAGGVVYSQRQHIFTPRANQIGRLWLTALNLVHKTIWCTTYKNAHCLLADKT